MTRIQEFVVLIIALCAVSLSSTFHEESSLRYFGFQLRWSPDQSGSTLTFELEEELDHIYFARVKNRFGHEFSTKVSQSDAERILGFRPKANPGSSRVHGSVPIYQVVFQDRRGLHSEYAGDLSSIDKGFTQLLVQDPCIKGIIKDALHEASAHRGTTYFYPYWLSRLYLNPWDGNFKLSSPSVLTINWMSPY